MIAVVTILMAFPLGYFLKSHLAANVAFAIAYLWAFTYQTLYLMLDSIANPGSKSAAYSPDEFPWSYGIVTLTIFGVGFALIAAGRLVRQRRLVSA